MTQAELFVQYIIMERSLKRLTMRQQTLQRLSSASTMLTFKCIKRRKDLLFSLSILVNYLKSYTI